MTYSFVNVYPESQQALFSQIQGISGVKHNKQQSLRFVSAVLQSLRDASGLMQLGLVHATLLYCQGNQIVMARLGKQSVLQFQEIQTQHDTRWCLQSFSGESKIDYCDLHLNLSVSEQLKSAPLLVLDPGLAGIGPESLLELFESGETPEGVSLWISNQFGGYPLLGRDFFWEMPHASQDSRMLLTLSQRNLDIANRHLQSVFPCIFQTHYLHDACVVLNEGQREAIQHAILVLQSYLGDLREKKCDLVGKTALSALRRFQLSDSSDKKRLLGFLFCQQQLSRLLSDPVLLQCEEDPAVRHFKRYLNVKLYGVERSAQAWFASAIQQQIPTSYAKAIGRLGLAEVKVIEQAHSRTEVALPYCVAATEPRSRRAHLMRAKRRSCVSQPVDNRYEVEKNLSSFNR